MKTRDLARMRAAIPDDYVFDDHRRVGLGRLASADDYLASVAALFEQAPDLTLEALYIVAVEQHGLLAMAHGFGTLVDGGAFEQVYVWLALYQGDRLVRTELFEPEDLEVARARFEELRPDPLRIPPNAACRLRDRTREAFEARDWQALRSVASSDFRWEDRRNHLAGDAELWIESMKQMGRIRRMSALIGTVGDRVALHRMVWSGGPAGGEFELEEIRLTEIDAAGRLRASINFDDDDRRAAFAEAQARFAAGEAAMIGGQAPIAALLRAFAQHDWEKLRGCLAEDAVLHDRRELGIIGALVRDEWIKSWRVLAELAPDVDYEWFRILAWNRHGRVTAGRMFGTMRDGGPFENVVVAVALTDGDRLQRYEFFDVGEADQALARFAELAADLA